MRRIEIKNIGPVKEAFLDLKKINILIGPQSTGKSTIAKIISYCTWVEKEISLSLTPEQFEADGFFEDNLVEFHKLQGFISDNSIIKFSSKTLNFEFKNKEFSFQWKDFNNYKRIKTLYIPAERNIVAVIPNWFEVNLKRNNTRSFLADWARVRSFFTQQQPLQLLNIASYYYDPTTESDKFASDNISFDIQNASSGLQAVTPLLSLFNYYSNYYYQDRTWYKEENLQVSEKSTNSAKLFIRNYLFDKDRRSQDNTIWNAFLKYIDEDIDKLMKDDDKNDKLISILLKFVRDLHTPHSTAFFIEEPEQNLYPTAQRDLMNHLVESISDKDHTIFITTHSPYLLTSINNLLYASQAGEVNEAAASNIIPKERWIKPSEIAAWKVCKDNNSLTPLLEDDIAMLRAEEIDDVSETINQEFDALFDILNSN